MTSEPHTRNHSTSGEHRGAQPQTEWNGAQTVGKPAIDERERLLDEELDDTSQPAIRLPGQWAARS